MAYYPESIMPPVAKSNVAGFSGAAGFMLAERYSTLAEEIIAIETFLGGRASEADEQLVANNKSSMQNVIGVINNLVRNVNSFTNAGILSTSGYVHSGQRMIFPNLAPATFMTSSPGPADTTIKVLSTTAFPSSGVISILNDANYGGENTGNSLVEWISYSSKSGTSFLNCLRGHLGTWAGTHSGLRNPTTTSTVKKNSLDQCVVLPIGTAICNRRYPGWRYGTIWSFLEFGLAGSLVEVTVAIRRNPASFDLSPSVLGANYGKIMDAAATVGILGYEGQNVLQSADSVYRALAELSWSEAFDFVDALKTAGVITTLLTPSDYVVDPSPYIPVFLGKMSVEYGTAVVTIPNQNAINGVVTTMGGSWSGPVPNITGTSIVDVASSIATYGSPFTDTHQNTATEMSSELQTGTCPTTGCATSKTSGAYTTLVRFTGTGFISAEGYIPTIFLNAGQEKWARGPVLSMGGNVEALSSTQMTVAVDPSFLTLPIWNLIIQQSGGNGLYSNTIDINNPKYVGPPPPDTTLATYTPMTVNGIYVARNAAVEPTFDVPEAICSIGNIDSQWSLAIGCKGASNRIYSCRYHLSYWPAAAGPTYDVFPIVGNGQTSGIANGYVANQVGISPNAHGLVEGNTSHLGSQIDVVFTTNNTCFYLIVDQVRQINEIVMATWIASGTNVMPAQLWYYNSSSSGLNAVRFSYEQGGSTGVLNLTGGPAGFDPNVCGVYDPSSLYLASRSRICVTGPSGGSLNLIAGNGTIGASGDGGQSVDATFDIVEMVVGHDPATTHHLLYVLNRKAGSSDDTYVRKLDLVTGIVTKVDIPLNAPDDIIQHIAVTGGGICYTAKGKAKVVRVDMQGGYSEIVIYKGEDASDTSGVRAMRDAAPTDVSKQMDKQSIIQTADGRLYLDTLSDETQTVPDQAIVQYKTFFVASSKQG